MKVNIPGDSVQKAEKSKVLIIGIVIAVLAILNGLLYFEYTTSKENLKETLALKTELQKELNETKKRFEEYTTKSEGQIEELDALVKTRNDQITAKAKKIEELLSEKRITRKQLKKIKRELATLKQDKEKYLSQIDSLYTANQYLIEQNKILQTDLGTEINRSQLLTDENVALANKVAIGSMLTTNNVSSTGVRISSFGNNEKEITKAKKVEKIRICFTINKNPIIDKGLKDIYIRVLGPDGAILTHNADEVFTANGQNTTFTIKGQIDYQNTEKDVCFYWDKGSSYSIGNYQVNIFENGNLIGGSGFELK